jgi:hypothetical protein
MLLPPKATLPAPGPTLSKLGSLISNTGVYQSLLCGADPLRSPPLHHSPLLPYPPTRPNLTPNPSIGNRKSLPTPLDPPPLPPHISLPIDRTVGRTIRLPHGNPMPLIMVTTNAEQHLGATCACPLYFSTGELLTISTSGGGSGIPMRILLLKI